MLSKTDDGMAFNCSRLPDLKNLKKSGLPEGSLSGVRILQVSTVCETLRHFVSPISRHFRKLGASVDAAASGATTDQTVCDAFDQCFELPLKRRLFSVGNLLAPWKTIRSLAESGQYDLVHVHTPIASFLTRFALRKMRDVKVLYTAHGFHFYDGAPILPSKVFELAERFAAPWTDHLIVINEMDRRNALTLGLADEESLTLMPGVGIDLPKYRQSDNAPEIRKRVRAELNLAPSCHVFLMVAGFSKNKRHCDAIKALGKIKDRGSFALLFAGADTVRCEFKQLAERLGVADQLHMLGFRTDIADLLIGCDTLLLISRREGLPCSVMEALAIGKTVIGTRIRGTEDLLENDVGILVEPCHPEQLARAMVESIHFAPDTIARERILSRCDLSGILAQHTRLYLDLLGR